MGAPRSRNISGPERTARVLEAVASADHPPSHSELALQLGVAKSTLSQLLAALGEIGYVERVPRGYLPGARLLALGHRLAPRAGFDEALRECLRPDLEALARATGETAVLLIELRGHESEPGFTLPIDHVQSSNPLRFVPVGDPQPMYRTAAGRVFLAFSGRSAAQLPPESLVKLTEKTIVDPRALDAELAQVLRQGYATSVEENLEGVAAISAPLIDADGRPVAAVSVFGPTQRHPDPGTSLWPPLQEMVTRAQLPPTESGEVPDRRDAATARQGGVPSSA